MLTVDQCKSMLNLLKQLELSNSSHSTNQDTQVISHKAYLWMMDQGVGRLPPMALLLVFCPKEPYANSSHLVT
ncbi:hypothetical protein VNO77_22912 [Canavalia gladiata]|uniref:Uncharacterized protein n=1 Tax=Canavalia gladiata TaxID=3824 RepID=A0AAN9Q8F3_CANGL